MKLALYSDLHLELLQGTSWRPPSLAADVVILAGDVHSGLQGLGWAADAFRQGPAAPDVIYVAGNHEHYDAHLGLFTEYQRRRWKARGVHVLERRVFVRPGLRILGCTLWSGFDLYGADKADACMAAVGRCINDYRLIHTRGGKRLEPWETRELHRKSVAWLDGALAKPFAGKTVVVTHFAPHRGCVAPHHRDSEASPYFVTDLAWLMEKHRIDVWCHGHTHTNNDFMAENGCRIVSNQRGYAHEADDSGFRPELLIEI